MDNTECQEQIEKVEDFLQSTRKALFWISCCFLANAGLAFINIVNLYAEDNGGLRCMTMCAVLVSTYGTCFCFVRRRCWVRRYKHACHLHRLFVQYSRMQHAATPAIEMQHDQIMAAFERLS